LVTVRGKSHRRRTKVKSKQTQGGGQVKCIASEGRPKGGWGRSIEEEETFIGKRKP